MANHIGTGLKIYFQSDAKVTLSPSPLLAGHVLDVAPSEPPPYDPAKAVTGVSKVDIKVKFDPAKLASDLEAFAAISQHVKDAAVAGVAKAIQEEILTTSAGPGLGLPAHYWEPVCDLRPRHHVGRSAQGWPVVVRLSTLRTRGRYRAPYTFVWDERDIRRGDLANAFLALRARNALAECRQPPGWTLP